MTELETEMLALKQGLERVQNVPQFTMLVSSSYSCIVSFSSRN